MQFDGRQEGGRQLGRRSRREHWNMREQMKPIVRTVVIAGSNAFHTPRSPFCSDLRLSTGSETPRQSAKARPCGLDVSETQTECIMLLRPVSELQREEQVKEVPNYSRRTIPASRWRWQPCWRCRCPARKDGDVGAHLLPVFPA